MNAITVKTSPDFTYFDTLPGDYITFEFAQKIFDYFKQAPLFRWQDANNDCEDRANAICILLDAWGVPNAKGWVFGDAYFNKGCGCLVNNWKYHVAAALPVMENNVVSYYIIDPSTISEITWVQPWADNITAVALSKFFIKKSCYYIFSSHKMETDNWHKRDKRNLNWTMHGLSGINGVSVIGKAQLAFHKKKVINTIRSFKKMMSVNPFI